jgi:hypothetical protein
LRETDEDDNGHAGTPDTVRRRSHRKSNSCTAANRSTRVSGVTGQPQRRPVRGRRKGTDKDNGAAACTRVGSGRVCFGRCWMWLMRMINAARLACLRARIATAVHCTSARRIVCVGVGCMHMYSAFVLTTSVCAIYIALCVHAAAPALAHCPDVPACVHVQRQPRNHGLNSNSTCICMASACPVSRWNIYSPTYVRVHSTQHTTS